MSAAWEAAKDGLTLRLRVTPNASADRIEGIETRDDGGDVIRIRVRAVPDRGKANAAVIALLAKTLGVPRSDCEVVAGTTARLKTVRISGDPGGLVARLEAAAMGALPKR